MTTETKKRIILTYSEVKEIVREYVMEHYEFDSDDELFFDDTYNGDYAVCDNDDFLTLETTSKIKTP